MFELQVPPYAPALAESIRSIGYTLESAIADLIDNSITAGANTVNIRFSPYGIPFIGLLDDGCGMNPDELTRAMRHGSDPNESRDIKDLGRFGLGLKTASLSQCRRLTVISLKEGILSARCWDLNVILSQKDWILVGLEQEEIRQLPLVDELERQGNGTLIIWHDLDRLAFGEKSVEAALGDKMERVSEHLSLVFHRYIGGEPGLHRLSLSINGSTVEPADPFFISNRATEHLPEENIEVSGSIVTVKPFVLPHLSKMSTEELSRAGGADGLRKQQGFYIYRNRRLIVWGTWFRLVRQEELTKLARVRVDIPNTLDQLWTVDIKKSAAHPPEAVRQNLQRIVDRIAEGSRRIYRFRGRRVNSDNMIHLWDRMQGREGFYYRVNRNHPLVAAMLENVNNGGNRLLELLLDSLEVSFPVEALYVDMASNHRIGTPDAAIREKLEELAARLLTAAEQIEGGRERLLDDLHILDPFYLYPEVTEEIVRGYSDAE